ncbi:3-methyl-2-oxobutanoate hydroxymethyltransferase [Thauera sinica]|uniref:3-methyl-2-oxobutanoate hydroxymethyltransferase n=1 Tax=Thauera sinica TaxID=2665146 RepID=A0ABW1ANB7_9RHOO|nr:3-methyl-2-oxobutanoate hydroxymethyltransferase [Thauera sp. K11]ATE61591.1 3-methyl-2-oxobutanoate hydroxymethyltransferase [Thauera sp. K11]
MTEQPRKKITLNTLRAKKQRGELITSIGVYDAPMAHIADRVGFDLLIVGNAGPMSLLGHEDPTTVSFEEQLFLTRAVSRSTRYGLVVGHLPYLSYHGSKAQAIASAGRMVSVGGAQAVKCEGNRYTAEYVAEIVRAGIPVMGHIGMQASRRTEQSGFGVKGKSAEEARHIIDSAQAFIDAGVFAFILEQVPVEPAAYLQEISPVPIITLGAGHHGDGIYHISGDVVGYSAFPIPRNRGAFVNVGPIIEEGLTRYRDECLAGTYPRAEQAFHMPPEELQKFRQGLPGER